MTDNENISPAEPQAQDAHVADDHKLAAEAARRRVQAREANDRADAAEQEAAQLRAQIAELRLSQARQAVTAKHPELTSELIEKFAPDNVDADSLADWADKSMQLVVALRGEAPVDDDDLSDAERELAEKNMQIARMEAVNDHDHVTDEALDTLCAATTPEGVAEWAEAFEQIAAEIANAKPESFVVRQRFLAGIQANKVGGGKLKGAGSGMESVAQKLTKR